MDEKKMGERIRNRRRELGMTIQDLALAVGTTHGTVSKWESGNIRNIRDDKISKICSALKVSPLDLLGMADKAIEAVVQPAVTQVMSPTAQDTIRQAVATIIKEIGGTIMTEDYDEQELLRVYRKLPPKKKQRLMAMVMLLEEDE